MGIFDAADSLLDAMEGVKRGRSEEEDTEQGESGENNIEDWAFAKASEYCKRYVIPSKRDDGAEMLIKLMEAAFARGAKAREEEDL